MTCAISTRCDCCVGALDERLGDLDLVGVPGSGVAVVEAPVEQPRRRRDAGERDARRAAAARPRRRRRSGTPSACAPSPSGRRTRRSPATLDREDQLAGLERRRPPVVLGRQPVERRDRQLAPVGADRRVRARAARRRRRKDAPRRRSRSRRSRARRARPRGRSTRRRRGDGTASFEPPVPAARRLQEVACERPHVAELRARGEPARLAQHVGNLRVALELGERRARRRSGSRRDPARHDVAHVEERLACDQPGPEERHELRTARK